MADLRYGLEGPPNATQLEVELQAFLIDPPPEQGGLGKAEHFWNVVSIVWGERSGLPKEQRFVRNPWSEKMIEYACKEQYLAVLGCAHSAKSDTFALWGLVNWMADPLHTLVLFTSTSLKDSRKRIWGRVVNYFSLCPGLQGRLIDSMGIIRTDDGSGVFLDNRGIALIAGEKKKEREAIGKMIGMKNERVFMIADELPELSEAILEAAFSNLASNAHFQLIGIGNFNSIYDPLGIFARPVKGYGAISPEDEEWETERGYCIRFDGLKSPNFLSGEEKWPFLYNTKRLKNHRDVYGENSAMLWRMCRSFPCPEGDKHVFYSESDFIQGKAHDAPVWLDTPVTVIGADPAFTNDGDNFAVIVGQFGKNQNGLPILAIKEYKYLRENMALTQNGEARDIQTARQLVDLARDNHVAPDNVGVDTSGPGGLAFGSILSTIWGTSRFHWVKFGELPTQRPVSEDDPKRCDEAFSNRVTELWATGRNFVRSGQIKSLPFDVAKELKSRLYKTVKGISMKQCAESKTDMKARVGFSPDYSDAFLILVDLCRERFGFTPGSMNGVRVQTIDRNTRWRQYAIKVHSVYEPENMYAKAS